MGSPGSVYEGIDQQLICLYSHQKGRSLLVPLIRKECSSAVDLQLCLPITVKWNTTMSFTQSIWGTQCRLYRVAHQRIFEGIDPMVDNATSFATYPREISTAPTSPISRCIANILKLTQISSFVFLVVQFL